MYVAVAAMCDCNDPMQASSSEFGLLATSLRLHQILTPSVSQVHDQVTDLMTDGYSIAMLTFT